MLGKSRLKYIQSLGHKKHREEEGLFIAEGPKIAAELVVTMKSQVREVFAVDSWITAYQPLLAGLTIIPVTEDELIRMSQLSTPNQVIVVLEVPEPVSSLQLQGRVTIALDTIQDPGNLGTIIRIADWFGITQIVCSNGSADLYNPKVVQSTMGSIARVQVLYTDLRAWLQENTTIGLYAAALAGTDISRMDKLKQGILIIGNESKGIDPDILDMVQNKVTIPRIGHAESLNAAVATGIILSHLV